MSGHLQVRHGLRPSDDRPHAKDGHGALLREEWLPARRRDRLWRYRLRDGEVRREDSGGGHGYRQRSCRTGVRKVPRPCQARVREGLLPLPSNEQEALRRSVLDQPCEVGQAGRQGNRDCPSRQLSSRANSCRHLP